MIGFQLSTDDVSRIRFAFSPIWETVTSVRALSNNSLGSVHGPWLRKVRPYVEGADLTLLRALIPADGYIPDFITPAPPRRSTSLESGLAAIAATSPELVVRELTMLNDGTPHPLLPGLIADPERALDRITGALRSYWQRTIEPDWRRMRALLQEDLAFRLDELASGGIDRLFRNLHPSVRLVGDRIEIDRPFCCYGGDVLSGQGLILIPCVFTWPTTLRVTAAPHVPMLTYPPRGLGRLWENRLETSGLGTTGSALAELVGRTRAAIVSHLDLPMSTTHLAHQLDLSAPTLSAHLSILRNAGVVDSRRDGRTVLYYRTSLGNHLLAASGSTTLSQTA
ncbi:helix-turn-helix protein [Kribbella sp. VKM Ac-2527]|uniref:Helix-turn-helix protein n=1 Tax=Kribbella caucasensis TaxID=2512215 RepID=A0A4V3CA41_9ACTN|nr:helix-turn-helix domain-containing protein [Kribbella sp. VKM Ac-2527]TDO48606.1 helix-turn-helix protein [Kribbella sp. VKM Ac-2527]